MRAVYQQRHQQIAESLDDRFADHLKPVPSAAGLHVAATAPASTPEELQAVLGRASAAGVELLLLSMFDVGPPSQPGIVLGYGPSRPPTSRRAWAGSGAASTADAAMSARIGLVDYVTYWLS